MIADYGYGYVTTSATTTTASEAAAAAASGHHGDPLQQAHNHFFPAKEDQDYYNGSIRISSRFKFQIGHSNLAFSFGCCTALIKDAI